jgi:hypothetical protein
MPDSFTPDELEDNEETFYYRDNRWSNGAGLCVSITRSQQMTMRFYELHGRSPKAQPKPKPKPRANSKAAKAKAEAVRSAVAKALAAKAARDGA